MTHSTVMRLSSGLNCTLDCELYTSQGMMMKTEVITCQTAYFRLIGLQCTVPCTQMAGRWLQTS